MIWPKLFRRIVPYLAAGFTDFDGFDAWLRADPVNRDDALFLLDPPGPATCTTSSPPPGTPSSSPCGPRSSSSPRTPRPPGTNTGPRRTPPATC